MGVSKGPLTGGGRASRVWMLIRGRRVIRGSSIHRWILGCTIHRWWLDVWIVVCCGTN
jgi:hypothetical protein